jgi:putative hemolysin
LGEALAPTGLGDDGGETIAVVVVTLATTFLALIIAELTPRRYAMQHPFRVALTLAPMLDVLASMLRPVIWVLEKCTNGVLRLLRADPRASRSEMSIEEVRELVLAHEELPDREKGIIRQVFAAGGRSIRQAMVPRANIDFLTATMTVEQARRAAWQHTHTRFPVHDAEPGSVIGFVHVRDLLAPDLDAGRPIRTLTRPITAYPPGKKLLAVLSEMQSGAAQIAAVVDEYGAVTGMVTLEDVVEELVGEMYDEYDVLPSEQAEPNGSGTVVDGLTGVGDFARRTGFELPVGRYDTVGGFLLAALDRTPHEGDSVEVGSHRLTVVSVDGWRVRQVRVESAPGRESAG